MAATDWTPLFDSLREFWLLWVLLLAALKEVSLVDATGQLRLTVLTGLKAFTILSVAILELWVISRVLFPAEAAPTMDSGAEQSAARYKKPSDS